MENLQLCLTEVQHIVRHILNMFNLTSFQSSTIRERAKRGACNKFLLRRIQLEIQYKKDQVLDLMKITSRICHDLKYLCIFKRIFKQENFKYLRKPRKLLQVIYKCLNICTCNRQMQKTTFSNFRRTISRKKQKFTTSKHPAVENVITKALFITNNKNILYTYSYKIRMYIGTIFVSLLNFTNKC